MTWIYSTTLQHLHEQMEACFQTVGLNMIQHGESVNAEYAKLIDDLDAGKSYPELQLLWDQKWEWAKSATTLRNYHVYHDCGKHISLTIDEDGRRHYPDHAAHSKKQYEIIFPNDTFSARLIGKDMLIHTLKGDALRGFLACDPDAFNLLLTAFAEIHANAQMFGGFDSDSFKIKKKHLLKATKILLSNCGD